MNSVRSRIGNGIVALDVLMGDHVDAAARSNLRANLIAVGVGTTFLVSLCAYCLLRVIVIRPLNRLIDEFRRVGQGDGDLRQSLDSFL